MSHFTVVILGDDIESQLAPFSESLETAPYKRYEKGEPSSFWCLEEMRQDGQVTAEQPSWADIANGYALRYEKTYEVDEHGMYEWSTYNPESKWDYWRIGGRWAGYFLLKPGAIGRPVDLSWEWAEASAQDRARALVRTDQAPKASLDLEGMRDEAQKRALDEWDAFDAIAVQHGSFQPWKAFLAQRDKGVLTIQEAREHYHAQPMLGALRVAELYVDPDEILGVSRDAYALRARLAAVPGYATLIDGQWYAPGRMGWFGLSTDSVDERIGYWENVNGLIDAASGDMLMTAVDCHI